jgi:hypothetical protein
VKRVVVEALCDLHSEPGEVPATSEVTFQGRLLDVCDEHKVEVDDAIQALVDLFESGVEVDAPPRAKRTAPPATRVKVGRRANPRTESAEWRTCPECGHVSPTRSANGGHIRLNHGKSLKEYDWST